jgi:hypothetical protein
VPLTSPIDAGSPGPLAARLAGSEVLKLARFLSPRRRRWHRFLERMNIDPDVLPRPLDSLGPRDFIICGSSRSGTSLASAALYQPPKCVTVMEPWDGMRLPPADLFASLRQELGSGVLRRGKLDIAALERDGDVRWLREGQSEFEISTASGYLLGVKWPAFWRYLDLLPHTRFIVCLRHPAEVIASYRQTGGRLAEGLDYDIAFNRSMNEHLRNTPGGPMLRRVLLFEYVHTRIVAHLDRPNVLAVRYERWFTERARVLEEISEFLDEDLSASRVRVRPPSGRHRLSPDEISLIRENCPTAEALGYSL